MTESAQFYLPPTLFNVVSATWFNLTHVDVEFDQEVDADALVAGSYTISDGVTVSAVTVVSSKIVRLVTSSHPAGVHTVTVDEDLESADGGELVVNLAAFLTPVQEPSPDAPVDILPADLEARTHCLGQRIDLSWTNVLGVDTNVQWVRVIRRQKNWAFDLTDPHDVVYDGPTINQFFDTGVLANPVLCEAAIAINANSIRVPAGSFDIGDVLRIDQFVGDIHYEIKTVTGVTSFDVDSDTVAVTPLFQTVFDVGARAARSSPLQPQTYYYYNVLVSDGEDPLDSAFAFTDSNRVAGLSIAEMDSKENFFWSHTPEYYREKDAEDGEGYLDKWYEIYGCWLNLMRGQATAIKLLNDDDETPYNTLSAKNISLGIEPEGFSYDYEIPRRSLLSLANVYKRRGSCEGMVRTVRMFTQWEASCAEFTLGGCANGAKALSAWDGQSLKQARSVSSGISQLYDEDVGRNVLLDLTSTFEDHLWRDGMVVGPLGDIVCVQDNLTVLTDDLLRGVIYKEPVRSHRVRASVAAGANVVALSSLQQLVPGMLIQLQGSVDKTKFEIAQIEEFYPETLEILLYEPLQFSYVKNDYVGIQKNQIRFEQVFTDFFASEEVPETDDEPEYVKLTYRGSVWVENQWKGYSVMLETGDVTEILKNDGDSIYIVGGEGGGLPDGYSIAIAKTFAGVSWASRQPVTEYLIYNGNHTFLFNPLFDMTLRNTRWDPYSRLWQGVGSTLLGAWGAADVGLYITTPVLVSMGQAGIGLDYHPSGVAEFQFVTLGEVPLVVGMSILLGPDLVEWTVTAFAVLTPGVEGDYGDFVRLELVCTLEGEAYLLPSDDATNAEIPGYPGALYPSGGWPESVNILETSMPVFSGTSSFITLDPNQPAPEVNEWVGWFLNPNQNQSRLFEIVSNTETTVTVGLDISGLVIEGVPYYVLKPRDANRFRALVNRFSAPAREFANMDIDVKLLFSPVDVELP
jgi:hypothetical protein